jgi:pyridoxamine 5'-phosphate oxidase
MAGNIADIRKHYSQKALSENEAENDPIIQFEKWWNDAMEAKVDEANAMTLATASLDGLPSARTVLLKEYSEKGFVFFTNYNSFKAQQLAENPKACLVFFWKEMERQVRITGLVSRVEDAENDAYFQSRPTESQLGALASPQSQVVSNREWLDKRYHELELKWSGGVIPRPGHWGGYRVRPIVIEFWQGRPGRLHDRLQYTLTDNGSWVIERLAP